MSATATSATSWRGYEARSYDGRLVSFWGPSNLTPQHQGQIRAAIGKAKDFNFPETHKVNMEHGGYGRYTRYNIDQTKYAGGRGGYIECLHVPDAPDGRCAHVIYRFGTAGNSRFFEFEDQTTADTAWEECVGKGHRIDEALGEQPGFIRRVYCDVMTPWFYAIGNQELVGDWAFPEYSQKHPYFEPGRLYAVRDKEGREQIKCCLGSRIIDAYSTTYDGYIAVDTVLVFWDDGTHFTSKVDGWLNERVALPRRVEESEPEIMQALGEFRELLATSPKLALEAVCDLQRQKDQLSLI